MATERTLAILKPDCVRRNLAGEVIRRIQDAGFQIRAMKLELEAACETPGCGYFVSFNVEQLIEQVGPDYWLPENGPGMPCLGRSGTARRPAATSASTCAS